MSKESKIIMDIGLTHVVLALGVEARELPEFEASLAYRDPSV